MTRHLFTLTTACLLALAGLAPAFAQDTKQTQEQAQQDKTESSEEEDKKT